MWQAIQYVGSGLSLVAFVVAAITYAYLGRLRERAKIISSAPERERLDAIAATGEWFRVDLSGLTNKQKQEIVLAQISARLKRDALIGRYALGIAVILGLIAIISIIWSLHGFDPPPDLKTKLIGSYQVKLGKNGGCNGGPAFTKPNTPAQIYNDGPTLMAKNECGQTTSIRVSGYPNTIYWFGESARVATNLPALTITDDYENVWEKLP
jgi:hypothetical protein